MTEKEAIYILRNAAWLGSNEERQKVEEAVEVVAKAIEAQDMTLYMNLPEVSAEEAVEILKRNNRIELLPSAQPEKTQLSGESTTKDSTFDCISRQQVIDRIEWWFEILKQNPDILIDAIKTLPPTHPEVIRCEDCKYNRECAIQFVANAGDKFFCGAGERRQDG